MTRNETSGRVWSNSVRLTLCVLSVFLLISCVRFEPKPLSASEQVLELESHSLTNERLRSFVALNFPRVLTNWSTNRWDLDMLTLAAFYYHPDLEVARAEWFVAQGGEVTAAQRPNPTLNITPGYDTTPSSLSPWFPLTFLDIPIETAGKRKYRMAHSARLSEAARWNVYSVAWQVRSSVRSNLVEYVAARQRAGTLEEQLSLQEQIVRLLEGQAQAGAIADSETVPFRIALQRLRLDSADARSQEASAGAGLAEALGVPKWALEDATLEFDLQRESNFAKELTSVEARRTALQSRADILSALEEYAASQAALQLEIAKQYPDVHLQPGYQFDQGDNKWSLGITVELPVLNQNQGPIAEANARRQEAAARFNALQARVLAEVERSTEMFRISESNSALFQTLAEQQARRRDAVAAQVKAGAAARLELLNAQFEFATTESMQIEGRFKLQQAFGALEAAVQRPMNLPETTFLSKHDNP